MGVKNRRCNLKKKLSSFLYVSRFYLKKHFVLAPFNMFQSSIQILKIPTRVIQKSKKGGSFFGTQGTLLTQTTITASVSDLQAIYGATEMCFDRLTDWLTREFNSK